MNGAAIDLGAHMRAVAFRLRVEALRGMSTGRMTPVENHYRRRCQRVDQTTSTVLLFTRDTGHHTSGWWKNPDYESCWHLSLSSAPPAIIMPNLVRAELDTKTRDAWVRAFYGDDVRLLWYEGPFSDIGKRAGVTHWRLFVDANWKPILPRGEVYSRELTEAGYKTSSEVLADAQAAERETGG